MDRDGAALLREPRHVDDADAEPVEMRGHADHRADGDDAGAADAGDQDRLVSAPGGAIAGSGSGGSASVATALPRFQHAAMHGHEGRAEPLQARIVLVAARLVDPPLAAELRLERLDRDAVRLDAAIAAALADERVDDDAPVGVGREAALAPPPLLRRAGLVVDEDGERPSPRAASRCTSSSSER